MYKNKYNKYHNKLLELQFGGTLPTVGYHSNIGGKLNQEDRVSVLAGKEYIILSVFDGHGGSDTSEYLINNLPMRCKLEIDKLPNLDNPIKIEKILNDEFRTIDSETVPQLKKIYTGSTGVICVITDKHIIVANVADSPAILFNKEGVKLKQTTIHNCDNPSEKARIDADNALPLCMIANPVTRHERLKDSYYNNGLDMTRAFGDQAFKPKANAVPQIYVWHRHPDQILCVCSDSFFENKLDGTKIDQNEQDIIDEVLPVLIKNNFEPQISAVEIVDRRATIIRGDNTSMILAVL